MTSNVLTLSILFSLWNHYCLFTKKTGVVLSLPWDICSWGLVFPPYFGYQYCFSAIQPIVEDNLLDIRPSKRNKLSNMFKYVKVWKYRNVSKMWWSMGKRHFSRRWRQNSGTFVPEFWRRRLETCLFPMDHHNWTYKIVKQPALDIYLKNFDVDVYTVLRDSTFFLSNVTYNIMWRS